jgi:hypothetical protein
MVDLGNFGMAEPFDKVRRDRKPTSSVSVTDDMAAILAMQLYIYSVSKQSCRNSYAPQNITKKVDAPAIRQNLWG